VVIRGEGGKSHHVFEAESRSHVLFLIPTLDRLLQSSFLHTKMISIVYSRRAEKLLIICSSKPEYDPSATSSFSFANAATNLSAVKVLEDSLY
jgi:hypothetical protein